MAIRPILAPAVLLAALCTAAPAPAQTLNSLSKLGGSLLSGQSGTSGGGSLLGTLGSNSLSVGNVAGVLGYCQQQGYAGSTVDTVKDRLLTQLGGQEKASQDQGYLTGLTGVLLGDNGEGFSLAKLKEFAGKKACSAIADKALSSFLGG